MEKSELKSITNPKGLNFTVGVGSVGCSGFVIPNSNHLIKNPNTLLNQLFQKPENAEYS